MFVKMNRELELQKVHHGRELILLFIFGSHCCMLWIDDVALNVSYIAARKNVRVRSPVLGSTSEWFPKTR